MTMVTNIHLKSFDRDRSHETVEYGECSNCGNQLIGQEDFGFPCTCPYCNVPLENGTDSRPWISRLYGSFFVLSETAVHQMAPIE